MTRLFFPLPAPGANNATTVIFNTHNKIPTGGTVLATVPVPMQMARPADIDAVTVVMLENNKAIAANGIRVYTPNTIEPSEQPTWLETDLKNNAGAATVGAAAPVTVGVLAAATEFRRTFVVSHLPGVAIELTEGADNAETRTGWVVVDFKEQTIAR